MDEVGISHRLAVYGSLRPGQPNHHELDDLYGEWRPGVVHGHLHDRGWGAELGYPGVVLDPQGPAVSVMVLTSPHLPDAWPRLDNFEGSAYRRSVVEVELDDGATVLANIYEICIRDGAGGRRYI